MKKYFATLIFILLVLINKSIAQASLRTNGANISIASGTYLMMPGDIKISGSSDYFFNNGTCYIAGNIANSGNSFNQPAATGTEIFNGNTTISGSNSYFNNLTILSGATVTLGSSIDILNNWTNNGLFVNGSKIVTFSGSVPVQYVFGSGTFYDLKLQNAVHFTSSKDTIDNSFSNSVGGMVDGTSRVVFRNNSSLIGTASKYFYDLEVFSGSNVTHNTSNGPIHIAHSFTNSGNLTEDPTYTFYFDSSNGAETMSGNGYTTFGSLTVGGPVLSNPTTLTTGTSNFTITGSALTFNSNNSSLTSNGVITFTRSTAGTTVIQKAGSVSNALANFYDALVSIPTATAATALNPGSSIAVFNHRLTINDNGSITTNAPFYGNAATLIYNTTNAALPTSLEWNASGTTAGLGIPFNVTVQNINNILLSGNRGVGGSLDIAPADALKINNNTLTLNGTITNTGLLTGSSASNINVGSSGALGTLYFDQTTSNVTNVLKNFTVNSGAQAIIGNGLNITGGTSGTYGSTSGILTINGTLNTGGYLTLRSNANGDAIAGQSTGTPVINGNVIVERYIPKKRAWRFLSVTTNSSQTINAAWQEGGINTGFGPLNTQDPNQGFGTEITYDNLPAHGFDFNTTYNPSIKVWDANTSDWSTTIPYTNSTQINTNPAYCLFVRGSRAVDLSLAVSAPADNTVLRTAGSLNYGNVTKQYNIVANNGVLVANPYASPIDILSILSANGANFYNQFAIWDPQFAGSYNVGGYRYYSAGWQAPGVGGYTGGTYAQSGQAFMLTAFNTANNVNVSFKESDKVSTSNEAIVFDKVVRQSHPAIYANLLTASGDSLAFVDGVTAGFGKEFSAGVDGSDARKFANFDENMILMRQGQFLAIELRPVPIFTDTLFYKLYLKQQPYTLQIFGKDLEDIPGEAWLVDKYLNIKTTVNMRDTILYNFTPNTDTNSYRNRFMLVFKRRFKATPVAITMSSEGVEATTLKPAVTVYPDPAITGEKIVLQFSNMKAGRYEISVSSLDGKALSEKFIQHKGGNNSYDLQLDARWATGDYVIKITDEKGYNSSTKLVIGK